MKKIRQSVFGLLLVCLLAGLVLLFTGVSPRQEAYAEETPSAVWGDLNGDGIVNLDDLTLLRQYLAGMDVGPGSGEEPSPEANIYFMDGEELVYTVATAGGETIALPEAPLRNGYTFDGWFLDEDGLEPFYSDSLLDDTLSSDLYVYAGWSLIDYPITYVLNGGVNAEGNPNSYTVLDSIALQSPTKDGAQFLGWYMEEDFSGDPVTTIAEGNFGPLTLYARFDDMSEDGLIMTVEQLRGIRMDGNYRLGQDLDLGGMEWTPLGTEDAPFTGSLDGQGFTVSNFKITQPGKYLGLFGAVKNAAFSDLHVEDFTIDVTMDPAELEPIYVSDTDRLWAIWQIAVGGLAGNALDATMTDCAVNGSIRTIVNSSVVAESGTTKNLNVYVGLLVGSSSWVDGRLTDLSMSGCSSEGEVHVEFTSEQGSDGSDFWTAQSVGGLVGDYSGTMTDCSSFADVVSSSTLSCDAGGLVGSKWGEITNSLAYGDVSAVAGDLGANAGGLAGVNSGTVDFCQAYGDVHAEAADTIESMNWVSPADSGGLVGFNNGAIYNSFAEGDVTAAGSEKSAYAGGLVGENTSNGEGIVNCYVLGNVSSYGPDAEGLASGGLVGWNWGMLVDSYARGNAEADIAKGGSLAGGLVGENRSTIIRCYATGNALANIAGGLAGSNAGAISDCFAVGNVRGEFASENVWTSVYADALVARTLEDGMVTNCYTAEGSTVEAVCNGEPTTNQSTPLAAETLAENFMSEAWMRENLWKGLGIWRFGDGYPIHDYSYFDEPYYFEIATVEQLLALQSQTLLGNYRLTADIDLGGVDWTPVILEGTFDGNGHIISNIVITEGVQHCQGFFAINYGTITDLGLVNCRSIGDGGTANGAFVGYNDGGTIERCFVTGTIDCYGDVGTYSSGYCPSWTGGFVGCNAGNIRDSFADVDVQAAVSQYDAVFGRNVIIGGFIGHSNMGLGEIHNSYALGDVLVDAGSAIATEDGAELAIYAGGFLDQNGGDFFNCFAYGDVTVLLPQGKAQAFVGGFTGDWEGEPLAYRYAEQEISVTRGGAAAEYTLREVGTPVSLADLRSASFYRDTLGWSEADWTIADDAFPGLSGFSGSPVLAAPGEEAETDFATHVFFWVETTWGAYKLEEVVATAGGEMIELPEGYIWFLDCDFTQPFTSDSLLDVTLTSDLYVYGKLVYQITYELNGGVNHPDNPTWYTGDDNFVLQAPSKEGAEFLGWYRDPWFTQPVTQVPISDESGTIIDDITLYAKFEELIMTKEQLMNIDMNGHHKLGQDIDLGGMEWTPLGTEDAPFTGSLDGQGFTISNFKITQPGKYLGLFGVAQGATFTNVHVADFVIDMEMTEFTFVENGWSEYEDENGNAVRFVTTSADAYVGGLVADSNGCTMQNCSVTGTIDFFAEWTDAADDGTEYHFTAYVGMLAGRILGGDVADCIADGNLSVTVTHPTVSTHIQFEGTVGGLAGDDYNSAFTRSTSHVNVSAISKDNLSVGGLLGSSWTIMNGCSASGTVTAEAGRDANVGGLVGSTWGGSIQGSFATGDVSLVINGNQYPSPAGNGYFSSCCNTGGLVGAAYSESSIMQCYVTGNVTVTSIADGGYENHVGGLVGLSGFYGSDGGTVSQCYATGNVTVQIDGNSPLDNQIGGLVGRNLKGIIQNSYATGTVELITNQWADCLLIGGLCGVNDRGQLLQCYAYGNVVLDCRQMSNGFYLGGLCGYSGCFNDPGYTPHDWGTMDPSEDAIIQDCVAFGNVSLIIADTENDPVAEFGGLIGRDDGVIGNSYRSEAQAVEGFGTANEIGTPVSLEEAQKAAFYRDTLYWSDEVWHLEDGLVPTLSALE